MNENGTQLTGLHPERYADCVFCGGDVLPEVRSYEAWLGDALCIVRNVPMGVCAQCHERYIHARVGVEIDRVLAGEGEPPKVREISEFNLASLDKAA